MKIWWKREIREIKEDRERRDTEKREEERMGGYSNMAEIGKNSKVMELLFEEIDEGKSHWNNKLVCSKMEGRFSKFQDEVNKKIDYELRKREENVKRGEIRRNSEEDGRGKLLNQIVGKDRERIREYNSNMRGMEIDSSWVREIMVPKFEDNGMENPRKFIEEIEDLMEVKGVPNEWRHVWFRKCVGDKALRKKF